MSTQDPISLTFKEITRKDANRPVENINPINWFPGQPVNLTAVFSNENGNTYYVDAKNLHDKCSAHVYANPDQPENTADHGIFKIEGNDRLQAIAGVRRRLEQRNTPTPQNA